MSKLLEKEVLPRLKEVFGPHLRVREQARASAEVDPDMIVQSGGTVFLIEAKLHADGNRVRPAVEQIRHFAERWRPKAVPVLVVSFMGETGRRLCAEAGVHWIDLSGNARIHAPGLRIEISGHPNRFPRRGRPSTPFAPKSARVARRLLLTFPKWRLQREMARDVSLGEGFVSRIVRRLEEDGLVERNPQGAVRARDPNRLLDAWHDVYDFSKHTILRGHIAARSGEELLRAVSRGLTDSRIRHAATALAAAWQYSRFAAFRLVSIYVAKAPSTDKLNALGFREESEAPNMWLIVPNDDGVFAGVAPTNGILCAHPIQVYLDLKGHPERAAEAAQKLREELIFWEKHGRQA